MDKRAFRFDMIAPSLIPGVHCIFFGIALAVAYKVCGISSLPQCTSLDKDNFRAVRKLVTSIEAVRENPQTTRLVLH
jgi:hypothetical protein